MWGNSALMSGCTQKVLSCIEVEFTSWTTLSSITTWCMHTMEPQSQDTPDDGKHWNWCHGVGRIIICHMIHLWSPVPGPKCIIKFVLNLAFIPLSKVQK